MGDKFCSCPQEKHTVIVPYWGAGRAPCLESSYAGEVGTVLIFLCYIYTDVWQGSSSLPASTYFDWFKWQCKPKPSVNLYWLGRDRQSNTWCFDHSKLKICPSNGIKYLHLAFKHTNIGSFFSLRILSPFFHALYSLGSWTY